MPEDEFYLYNREQNKELEEIMRLYWRGEWLGYQQTMKAMKNTRIQMLRFLYKKNFSYKVKSLKKHHGLITAEGDIKSLRHRNLVDVIRAGADNHRISELGENIYEFVLANYLKWKKLC